MGKRGKDKETIIMMRHKVEAKDNKEGNRERVNEEVYLHDERL